VPVSRSVIVLLFVLLLCAPVSVAHAHEMLQNGDFEGGTSGWSGLGISSGCTAHGGSNALTLSSNGSTSFAQQNVDGPLGEGPYALTGWLLATSGSPEVTLNLVWLDGDGSELSHASDIVSPGTSYASFNLNASRPARAESLRVRVTVDADGPAIVCLDDVSLDGPPEPTATPVPTATPPPTATQVPPTSVPPTPKPSSTPKATATTKPAPTAKPKATTAAASAPGTFTFVNGGFEQGLDGWHKYGGELRLVTQPVYAGSAAGELFSNSDSTKWAYQTVHIDASQAYEFSGYVNAGPGVSKAYLRISWYAAADGSGQAISTSDSTAVLSGASGGYVLLTTGAVAPPAGALSAKPRVLLTPPGAAPVTIEFDELSFTIAAPPTATPQPSPTQITDRPAPTPVAAVLSSNAGSPVEDPESDPEGWDPDVEPTPHQEVSAVVADAGPPDDIGDVQLTQPPNDGGVPFVWLAAGALFAAGVGGSYVYGRHRQ
jgi:hypothetical protein